MMNSTPSVQAAWNVRTLTKLLGGMLLLSLVFACWLPWWAFSVGIVLIGIGIVFGATRSPKVGGGVILCGLLLFGLSIVTLRVSSAMAAQRQEKEIQLASAEVAEHVKVAQEYFDKRQFDSAEAELAKASAIPKAEGTQAIDALRGRIQQERHEAEAFSAIRDVREKVFLAKQSFDVGSLEGAEKRLHEALSIPHATETDEARELLGKVQAALADKRQKLANEQVAKMAESASESFASGQLDVAEELLSAAILVKDATATQQASELLTKVHTAQADAILRTAEQSEKEKDFAGALKSLRDYLGPAEQLLSRLSGKIDIGESADFV